MSLLAPPLSARRRLIAVLCGGFCGTVTRYLLSLWLQAWLGKAWPYDILLINLTGACILAFVTTLADATFLVGPTRRLLINVGFLGAYTTFSSLALGDILLFAAGKWLPALLYLILSIAGGVLAVLLGDTLGQWLINTVTRPSPSRTTQKLAETIHPFAEATYDGHIDMQDDLLLPNEVDKHETRKLH